MRNQNGGLVIDMQRPRRHCGLNSQRVSAEPARRPTITVHDFTPELACLTIIQVHRVPT